MTTRRILLGLFLLNLLLGYWCYRVGKGNSERWAALPAAIQDTVTVPVPDKEWAPEAVETIHYYKRLTGQLTELIKLQGALCDRFDRDTLLRLSEMAEQVERERNEWNAAATADLKAKLKTLENEQ